MCCYVLGSTYLHHLSIGISSSPSVDDHTECATRTAEIPLNTNVTLPCEGTGRYVSFKKVGGDRVDAMYFCEVVVKGYKYRGKCTHACPCHNTCTFTRYILCTSVRWLSRDTSTEVSVDLYINEGKLQKHLLYCNIYHSKWDQATFYLNI